MTMDGSFPAGHDGRSLLKDMPSSIKRYRYQGKEHFFRIKNIELDRFENSTPDSDTEDIVNEYILFEISKPILERDFLAPDRDGPLFLFSSFDTMQNLLLVRMTTRKHSQAIEAFGYAIMDQLSRMGLRSIVETFSGTAIKAGASGKQGDHGWSPLRPPCGYPHHPTVVLEVAVSETKAKLERDVLFWLDPERGNANIAITLKVNRKKPVITIQKWEWLYESPRSTQEIIIAEDTTGENITVSKHPLVIPFHLLMRRQASTPVESDITIEMADLKEIAQRIWNVQDF
ncbi:uncharacterized protein N7529_005518 [Penicillium soppii]|uniref:uncharacterized protein n=1 Tax=Penicillium soppii TaxID=69789 RepID=UPI0025484307|nr:uncharacterized protein N7529_005518 [Penicillium soppii]KAJ5863602.1 hypothetical protein N7529_005518 [Penicillium soppii]